MVIAFINSELLWLNQNQPQMVMELCTNILAISVN